MISVIPHVFYRHKPTGKQASIYGASPWYSDREKEEWETVTKGYTWYDSRRGTVGLGRVPAKTVEEAQEIANKANAIMYPFKEKVNGYA